MLHTEIGEAQRNGRAHSDLLENGIFFCGDTYVPPTPGQLYGHLEPIVLPPFDDPAWPLPDMHCSEAFRAKFYSDFKGVTKARTGSSMGHLQWFLPMHVMVDLFYVAQNLRQTPTMVVVNGPYEELFSSLMDPGWDSKSHCGKDIINCMVAKHTAKFRRGQYVSLGCAYLQQLVTTHIDQVHNEVMVEVKLVFGDQEIGTIEVGKTWPVHHISHV